MKVQIIFMNAIIILVRNHLIQIHLYSTREMTIQFNIVKKDFFFFIFFSLKAYIEFSVKETLLQSSETLKFNGTYMVVEKFIQ